MRRVFVHCGCDAGRERHHRRCIDLSGKLDSDSERQAGRALHHRNLAAQQRDSDARVIGMAIEASSKSKQGGAFQMRVVSGR